MRPRDSAAFLLPPATARTSASVRRRANAHSDDQVVSAANNDHGYVPSLMRAATAKSLLPQREDVVSRRARSSSRLPDGDLLLMQTENMSLGTSAAGNSWLEDMLSQKRAKNAVNSTPAAHSLVMSDMEEDDLTELPIPSLVRSPVIKSSGRPISLKEATAVKALVLGSGVSQIPEGWRGQSFAHGPVKFAIPQHKGGPCGVLAAVEAFIVKSILFESSAKLDKLLALSDQERSAALAAAMASMLSLCRSELASHVVVAMPTAKAHLSNQEGYRRDGFTETLALHEFRGEDAARAFLVDNIWAFTRAGQSAALALVFSSVLTRSAEGILEDMDDSGTTLVARHGYCSQELVNLLVTGRAVSNVFDYTVTLPSDCADEPATVLKGISRPSCVGLLSLFEHYGSCAVGEHLKTPSLPIWLVCAESHFGLLFGSTSGLERASAADRHPIELHYYDGLSRPEELIRLTVDCSLSAASPAYKQSLAAPLEQCIRTKWHDATVNWNGSEKIL